MHTHLNVPLACPPEMYRACVRIGGLSIGLSAASPNDIHLTTELGAFRTDSAICDIEIIIEWAEQLEKLELKRLFDSGSLWTLYAQPSGLIFDFATTVLGSQPYKRLYVKKGEGSRGSCLRISGFRNRGTFVFRALGRRKEYHDSSLGKIPRCSSSE